MSKKDGTVNGYMRIGVLTLVFLGVPLAMTCKEQGNKATGKKFAAEQRVSQPPVAAPPVTPPASGDDDDGSDTGKPSPTPEIAVVDEETIELEPDVGGTLMIMGLRSDNAVTIDFTRPEGGVTSIGWPTKGGMATVDGACAAGDGVTTLSFVVHQGGGTFAPSQPKCFVGFQAALNQVVVGFEKDCDSTNYSSIDDQIASFTCPTGSLTIQGLRLDPGIDMGRWVD